MNTIERAKEALSRLSPANRYEAMVEVAAVFTELVEKEGLIPVIVGGLAVEVYTRGNYTTLDIDLIFSRRQLADEILTQLGFIRESRHWYHPEIQVSIEIPSDVLEDADQDKIIKVNLPSGRHIYIIGIEDIILDRLRACVHRQSSSDCEWGLRMLKVHFDSLDIQYMVAKAQSDHRRTLQKLKEWLRETL